MARSDPTPHATMPEPDLRIGFILQPQFTLLAFAGFVDVIRHAADEGDQSRQILCRWRVLGDPGAGISASCGGVVVHPDIAMGEVDPSDFDYVVVVGGLIPGGRDIDPEVYPYLRRSRAAGTRIIGLCTGFFHLARAGLLSGRRCCVPWMYSARLAADHPDCLAVDGASYVEDDGIITSLGGIAAMDLALAIVERHCGGLRSRKCIDRLCINDAFGGRRALSSIGEEFEVRGDQTLERAVQLMRQGFGGWINLEEIAAKVGVSDRHLRSLFRRHTGRSPGEFRRDMRFAEVKWRLANGSQSVTEIAYATGFSDSAHLSRAFGTAFGITPKAFRSLRLQAERRVPKYASYSDRRERAAAREARGWAPDGI